MRPGGVVREAGLWAAAALLVRALYWAATQRVVDSPDALLYLWAASDFPVNTDALRAYSLPPLYPFLAACIHTAVPSVELAARLGSLIVSSLAVGLGFLLARRLFARRTARYAAFILSAMPWMVDYGTRIATEALALPLFLGGVLGTVWAGRRRGLWAGLVPAALFYLLHLTRPEATFLLLGMPLGIGLAARRNRLKKILAAAGWAVLLLAGQALVMLAMSGEAAVNSRMGSPAAGMGFVLRNLGGIAGAALRLYAVKLPIMAGPVLGVFTLIGAFAPGKRKLRLERTLAYFMLLQCALAPLGGYAEPRYLMAVVAGLCLWGARGIRVSEVYLRHRGARLTWVPLACMAGLYAFGWVEAYARCVWAPLPAMPYEYRIAGEWLGAHHPPGLILSRKPMVGHYAGMPVTGPAAGDSPAEAVARAQAVNARYLVVDERYTAKLVPGLAPLLEPANAPPQLEVLRADLSPYPAGRIVIYEVKPQPERPIEQ